MLDRRRKDETWAVCSEINPDMTFDGAQLAVLMDIRDELKRLNTLLHCPNFVEFPHILRRIRLNTTKRKRKVNR